MDGAVRISCVCLLAALCGFCSATSTGTSCHMEGDTTKKVCIQGRHLVNELERYVNKEMHTGYKYTHMGQYYERGDKAYHGFAKLFKAQAERAKGNAHELMEYFNKRGTTLKLLTVQEPQVTTYQNLSYSVLQVITHERFLNDALLKIHGDADQEPHLQYFIEETYLDQKVEIIKKMADLRSYLERLQGDHNGEHMIDQRLAQDKWF